MPLPSITTFALKVSGQRKWTGLVNRAIREEHEAAEFVDYHGQYLAFTDYEVIKALDEVLPARINLPDLEGPFDMTIQEFEAAILDMHGELAVDAAEVEGASGEED